MTLKYEVDSPEDVQYLSTSHTSNLNKEFRGRITKYQYQVECGNSIINCYTFDDAINLMYEKSIEKSIEATVIDSKGKRICSTGLLKGKEK